jgi:hypothetical protein
MFFALSFLSLFGLEATLWAFHYFFAGRGPQACFALRTETQGGKTPLLFEGGLDHAEKFFGIFLC